MTYRAELAYKKFTETMEYYGVTQPPFEDLPEHVKLAWANVAQTVASEAVRKNIDGLGQRTVEEYLADEAQSNLTQL